MFLAQQAKEINMQDNDICGLCGLSGAVQVPIIYSNHGETDRFIALSKTETIEWSEPNDPTTLNVKPK